MGVLKSCVFLVFRMMQELSKQVVRISNTVKDATPQKWRLNGET